MVNLKTEIRLDSQSAKEISYGDALDILVHTYEHYSFSGSRVIRCPSGEMITCKGTDSLNQVSLVSRHLEGKVVHLSRSSGRS